ncbi:hypothetical protein FGB62_9g00 [Gracilaria domingensis]|nr:hypothetical protein FGB62_9g00 [Gracilaria domingensis]
MANEHNTDWRTKVAYSSRVHVVAVAVGAGGGGGGSNGVTQAVRTAMAARSPRLRGTFVREAAQRHQGAITRSCITLVTQLVRRGMLRWLRNLRRESPSRRVCCAALPATSASTALVVSCVQTAPQPPTQSYQAPSGCPAPAAHRAPTAAAAA